MTNFDTVREALESVMDTADWGACQKALAALAELERTHFTSEDVADASAQGFRDGAASVTAGQGPVAYLCGDGRWVLAEDLADQPDKERFKIPAYAAPVAQQPQAEPSEYERGRKAGITQVYDSLLAQQAEAVPPTHVLVPVDEPTDEMVDAACAAVDGLCRVDFVRAYVAAFAHLKAGYRDESYWCGWNAAIKFQQAESAHQYNLANRLRVHLANRHTLTGPEFKDGVAAILAEYYAAPQQAEAVLTGIMYLADSYARDYASRDIPTGELYRSVAESNTIRSRLALVNAIERAVLAKQPQAEAVPPGFKHVCYLWANRETLEYEVDHATHPLDELIPAYIAAAPKGQP